VFDPLQLPFVQRGIFEVLLLSVGLGLLGTWIVLRGLAFYSHALATAALPGLVLADGLGFAPQLGALGVGLLFAVAVGRLGSGRRDFYDSRTALVLVGALAAGVILASDVFHSGSHIDALLFGSLLLLDSRDLVFAAALSAAALGGSLLLGRAWLVSGFDPGGARALGIPARLPELALLALIALAAVAVLSAVGALLAAALLVMPAATTRLWSRRMPGWQLATIALVAAEGGAGLWISVEMNAPPGAAIAVLAGGVFALAAGLRAAPAPIRRAVPAAAGVLACSALIAGCATTAGSTGNRVDVVATTTQIGDFAREVGGGAVSVHQILQPNTDPHDYEPRPDDVLATASADVVFENGDELDAWMGHVVDESGTGARVVDLSTRLRVKLPGETSGDEASRYDPHWWHDPVNAAAAVREIRDALVAADPARRRAYGRNAAAYLGKLSALRTGISRCLSRVPARDRELVTDHDSFDYFAHRFGIRVIGAVIPSQTTEAQPSAGEISALADVVRAHRVRAIFPESSVSSALADALAQQTGASSAYSLYGDTLGPSGSDGATYLGMERANTLAMTRGFTGGRGCRIGGPG
jgi:ABC-type Zn uptake system ZnuABC Zn-binding protein ZnuA/ABC-type Mn2+/Zn2+ transport system permease subunit